MAKPNIQLNIKFSDNVFTDVREQYRLQYVAKLEKQVVNLKNIIRAYKGHKTRRENGK